MVYRYYIGIRLPDTVRMTIAQVQQELFDTVRMIVPLEPHITLLPPPFMERIAPETLLPAAKTVAARFLPVTATLTGVRLLASRAIVIEVNSHTLHDLRAALVALLPAGQFRSDDVFRPHITLAQAMRGKRLPPQLQQAYQVRLGTLLPCSISITQLTLFCWQSPRAYTAEPI